MSSATGEITSAAVTAAGTRQDPTEAPDRRRWLILAVVALAQLMVVLDATIVNIALPSAQRALVFSNVDRQWVVTAYALAFGSLLLLGGRLADLLGRKVTFLAGLAGFAAASAAGGAASSFGMLVAARACQGAFGALLAPSALSLLTVTFSGSRDRGKAFGVFGAIAGAGGGIGLLLGGLLTEYLSWRWCLYVNLGFAVVAGAGAALLLRGERAQRQTSLDLPGFLAEAAGMFCIVYGFSNAASDGWHAAATWGFVAAGGAALAVFAWWETRAAQPLLPLRLLLDRNRAAAYLSVLVAGGGMFGIFLFLTYYLQETLGYTPVATGVAFLPMVACIVVLANLSNIAVLPRIGPKFLVAAGMLAAASGLAWLTRIGLHSSYPVDVLPPLLLAAGGIGMIMSPSMNTGTSGVRASDAGVASALVNTGQQVGGSIGTSLLNTMAAGAAAAYVAVHMAAARIAGAPPAGHQAGHLTAGQLAAAHRAAAHQATALAELAQVHGYITAFWWAAGIFACGAAAAVLLFRRGAPAQPGTPAR